MIEGVPGFVPQQHLAPLRRSAFYFQHLAKFQRAQTGVSQVERHRDGGYAFRREPFVAQVAIGTHAHAAGGEILVKFADARFQFAFDADAEIADAKREQLLVFEGDPGGLASVSIGSIVARLDILAVR